MMKMNKYEDAYSMMMCISLKLSIDGNNEEVVKMNDNLAILGELVDKATPKRVIVSKPDKYEFGTVECPNCHKSLPPWKRQEYCDVCGQKLQWGRRR